MPTLVCPRCSARLRVDDQGLESVRCPKCETVIRIKNALVKPKPKPQFEVVDDEEDIPPPSKRVVFTQPPPPPNRDRRTTRSVRDDYEDDDYEDDDRPRRLSKGERRRRARSSVAGPAIIMIILSMICIGLVALGLVLDFIALVGGGLNPVGPVRGIVSPELKLIIRIVWGMVMLASNIFITTGAFKMKNLESLSSARMACILSLIPLTGPCCFFGIPFGIWGLIVLANPDVRRAFRS